MSKMLLKIILNALLLVTLVVIGVVVIGRWIPDNVLVETKPTIIARSAILERIHHVNKQIFIEHYISVDVDYNEVPEGWIKILGIKQEFVVMIRGRVPAGFDLQQLLSEDNIWISSDGRRAQLTLPPPMIFEENVAIDFENSYTLAEHDTCPGFICKDDLVAYQSEILPAGKKLLIEFALKSGILEQAARDGKVYYEQLLRTFGFEEVKVIVTGYDS
jgi:hypothetical protein